MKKTQRKDALRNIHTNLISFLSVILVVTMGLTGMFSLKYMSKGIKQKADEYYSERSFKNFEMVSSAGVMNEDIEKIRLTDGVKNAEGIIMSSDASLESGTVKTRITLMTLTEEVSVPEVTEGRLPKADNECMIGEDFAADSGLKVGDTVKLGYGNYMGELSKLLGEPLTADGFVITGLMHHPDYLRRREINTVVVPKTAVKKNPITGDIYNRVVVKCDDGDEEDVYERLVKLSPELEKDGEERIQDLRERFAPDNNDDKDILQKLIKGSSGLLDGISIPEDLSCNWLVLKRNANAGFMDVSSNIKAISNVANIFGGLFMLITAVVCFSTLVIIIDGQKRQVGTVKAFGFHKKEILAKYLSYGVLSVIIGDIAGITLSLMISGILQGKFSDSGMYQFDTAKSVITPASTIIACVLMIVIVGCASFLACNEILKTPASLLMKGIKNSGAKKASDRRKDSAKEAFGKDEEGTKKTAGNAGTTSRKGSLYTRLIFRNILSDKARVIVSIGVIMASCMLIGMGISFKKAFAGMSERETEDVYLYDFRLDLNGSDMGAETEKLLKDKGCDYLPAFYGSYPVYLNGQVDGINVLCADKNAISDYFSLKPVGEDEDIILPDDGIIVQNKLKERFGVNEGESLTLLDQGLNEHKAQVKAVFQNYVGRLMAVSPEMYKKLFGSEPQTNCYYIKLNKADGTEVKAALSDIDPKLTFENEDDFVTKYESINKSYNLMIFLAIGIAVLMSFMILMNLANIFLDRKKKELAIMRINGFSAGKCIGYLAREALITTIGGALAGVAAGAVSTPFIIRFMEQPDLNFDRSFKPTAWIAAVLIEFLFAFIVYGLVFRKVRKLTFRDIG